jgi:hypothetical protein
MPATPLRGTLHLPADKSIATVPSFSPRWATAPPRWPCTGRRGRPLHHRRPRRPGCPHDAVHRQRRALGLTIAGGGRSDSAALPGTEPVTLDCGNSGTLMRLLTGAATTRAGRTTLTATPPSRHAPWSASPSRCGRWAQR